MEFDLENPLFNDLQQSLFDIESDHIPLSNADLESDHHLRRQLINLISLFSKKHNQPFVSYLAMTYLHRFLASHSIPGEKPWILKLVAVSCVSIALKMINGDSALQRDDSLNLDVGMVERMEFVILGALQWRTRSVTPFAFIRFFLSLFKLETSSFHVVNDYDDHHQVLKDRATEIIFKAQVESKLLDFKPSVIAASALLCASHELYPLQFPDFKNSVLSCVYVNEDELSKCECMIQELVMDGYELMLSCKSTPINILDLDYSSSEDTHTKTEEEEDDDDDEKRGLKRGFTVLRGLCRSGLAAGGSESDSQSAACERGGEACDCRFGTVITAWCRHPCRDVLPGARVVLVAAAAC
ncbi:hypothetical protein M8C21_026201 [Ambrosia artemisiifolia]|uniref:Cyclin C-terminal domain-containing protein n=1 Tax=Ambrosia artemisiifolia TaxID=4212 RepID=A0AAD5BKP2_AMBAR|nr:hypothetical protein M8C21_026201 [Ambrosia artemisiifolia]